MVSLNLFLTSPIHNRTNVTSQYVKEKAQFELGFYLPKGSYASALLKEIKHEKGENNDEF